MLFCFINFILICTIGKRIESGESDRVIGKPSKAKQPHTSVDAHTCTIHTCTSFLGASHVCYFKNQK